jgi:hypothetical protein
MIHGSEDLLYSCCPSEVIASATVFRSVQGSYEGFCFMKSLRGYLKHNRNIDKEFIIFGVGARKS